MATADSQRLRVRVTVCLWKTYQSGHRNVSKHSCSIIHFSTVDPCLQRGPNTHRSANKLVNAFQRSTGAVNPSGATRMQCFMKKLWARSSFFQRLSPPQSHHNLCCLEAPLEESNCELVSYFLRWSFGQCYTSEWCSEVSVDVLTLFWPWS